MSSSFAAQELKDATDKISAKTNGTRKDIESDVATLQKDMAKLMGQIGDILAANPTVPEFVRYWTNSEQRRFLALDGFSANDPFRTSHTQFAIVIPLEHIDLTDFLNQRDRDYCIGMISSRW